MTSLKYIKNIRQRHMAAIRFVAVSISTVAVCVIVFWALTHKNAFGAAVKDNIYYASVVKVIDGDTFQAKINIWPSLHVVIKIRAGGFDTPEYGRPRCRAERVGGIKARNAAIKFLGKEVILKNVRPGKFASRLVADIYSLDGDSLRQHLINLGLARAYDGRSKRKGWCK